MGYADLRIRCAKGQLLQRPPARVSIGRERKAQTSPFNHANLRTPMPTHPILKEISAEQLCEFVSHQLAHFFPDPIPVKAADLACYAGRALERTYACFSNIRRPKFQSGDGPFFNYRHPDHYATFLYLLSNSAFQMAQDERVAFRVYYLNKALHAFDAFYDIALPETFQIMHPTGTILGHAVYGNYFCVYQNCTVGSDEFGNFPSFGDAVVLYAGARVIGKSRVGSNVVVGTNALVIDRDIPDGKVVISGDSRPRIAENPRHVLDRRFR